MNLFQQWLWHSCLLWSLWFQLNPLYCCKYFRWSCPHPLAIHIRHICHLLLNLGCLRDTQTSLQDRSQTKDFKKLEGPKAPHLLRSSIYKIYLRRNSWLPKYSNLYSEFIYSRIRVEVCLDEGFQICESL